MTAIAEGPWKCIDNGDNKSDLCPTLELPTLKPEVEVPVIEVFLKDE